MTDGETSGERAPGTDLHAAHLEDVRAKLDLTWIDATREWGAHARPGKHGLTLDAIRVGLYGEIPEVDEYPSEMPRGAVAKGALPLFTSLVEKKDVWTDSAAALYEEGNQRRWSPATDIAWETVTPLEEYTELGVRQLCTELSELSLAFGDAIGGWNKEISYAYYEVKMMLAGQQFDCMRQFDAFRKRAELRVQGLGMESPGNLILLMLGAKTWMEMIIYAHVAGASFTLDLYRLGGAAAHNLAERQIFAYAQQDITRRLAYGLELIRNMIEADPRKRPLVSAILARAEGAVATDWLTDGALTEALGVILGGPTHGEFEGGKQALLEFRRASVECYLKRLSVLDMEEARREQLSPLLHGAVTDPERLAESMRMVGPRRMV